MDIILKGGYFKDEVKRFEKEVSIDIIYCFVLIFYLFYDIIMIKIFFVDDGNIE